MHRIGALATMAALLGLGACGEMRDQGGEPSAKYTYLADVAPLLASKCSTCHGASGPKGGYDLSSWRGLLGPGSDLVRNVVAGDASSKLLTVLSTDAAHKALLSAEQAALLTSWVVEDSLAYFNSNYHGKAWLYPGDRENKTFHGGALRQARWDTSPCKGCHGNDLKGGTSQKSCESCHSGGVAACGTCHGTAASGGGPAPDLAWNLDPGKPGVGLHSVHTGTTSMVGTALTCADCHRVPTKLEDKGHVDSTAPAELTFGDRASGKAQKAAITPAYDRTSATCTQVYCHSLDGGSVKEWTWTRKLGAALACSSCHGSPPSKTSSGSSHSSGTDCAGCHSAAYKGGSLDPTVHINGKVDL